MPDSYEEWSRRTTECNNVRDTPLAVHLASVSRISAYKLEDIGYQEGNRDDSTFNPSRVGGGRPSVDLPRPSPQSDLGTVMPPSPSRSNASHTKTCLTSSHRYFKVLYSGVSGGRWVNTSILRRCCDDDVRLSGDVALQHTVLRKGNWYCIYGYNG